MFPDVIYNGFGLGDIALALNRVAVGTFFSISGYHKLFVKSRHDALKQTLEADHVPLVRINQWFVPSVEMIAGAALLLGFASTVAALLLGAICLVACRVDGRKRVQSYNPIDGADRLDDWLYLPEVLYGVMLLLVVIAGPGVLRIT